MVTQLALIPAVPNRTTCLRCRHPLSDPVSVARGYGPHCWAVMEPFAHGAVHEKSVGDGAVHMSLLRATPDEEC